MLEITTEIDGDTIGEMLSNVDADTIHEFADELASKLISPDLEPFLAGFLGGLADEELDLAGSLLQRERDARVEYAAATAPDPDATGEAAIVNEA